MMIHRIKLFFFKNQPVVYGWIIYFFMIANFALLLIMVNAILNQSRQNEELLKGLSCILLIAPEKRTQENVKNCITGNQTTRKDFNFKTEKEVKKAPKPESKIPPQTMSFPETTRTATRAVPKTSEPKEYPPIERRTREDGVEEYRYEGDTLWQLCTEEACD